MQREKCKGKNARNKKSQRDKMAEKTQKKNARGKRKEKTQEKTQRKNIWPSAEKKTHSIPKCHNGFCTIFLQLIV